MGRIQKAYASKFRQLLSQVRARRLDQGVDFLLSQARCKRAENRISVERRRFNENVRTYNTYIKKAPQNMVAGFFDFEKMAYFEVQDAARTTPKVSF